MKLPTIKKDRNRYDPELETEDTTFKDLLRDLYLLNIYKNTYEYLRENKRTTCKTIKKDLEYLVRKLRSLMILRRLKIYLKKIELLKLKLLKTKNTLAEGS